MIKIIAFAAMLLDHIGKVYFPSNFLLYVIGRIAFPLFAWGIARGYRRTRNINIYAIRLLIIAVVSQIPYSLLLKTGYLNICFTLLAGLLVIRIYDMQLHNLLKWPAILLLLITSQILNFEYGIYGVLTIFVFYIFNDKDYVILIQAALTLACIIVFRFDPVQLISVLSPILILFIAKYDFKLNKIIQYGFYPTHLTALFILTILVPGIK